MLEIATIKKLYFLYVYYFRKLKLFSIISPNRKMIITNKHVLRSLEAAFWAFVEPSELSTFCAPPDGDFSAAGAWELCCFSSGADYSVARRAHGHRDGFAFAHQLHLKRDGIITEHIHIYAILH